MQERCAVCECEDEEIPRRWLEADREEVAGSGECGCGSGKGEEVQEATEVGGEVSGWELPVGGLAQKQWIVQEEGAGTRYVDLPENPEGYTGYGGARAGRVWSAIHKENCFVEERGGEGGEEEEGECEEEKVFSRVVSGLQSSITAHIAMNANQGEAVPALFVDRVAKFPDRLSNLYLTYLFVARAIHRASPLLTHMTFATGKEEEDTRARALVAQLVRGEGRSKEAVERVQSGFNETRLFSLTPAEIAAACPPVVHGLEDLAALQTRMQSALERKLRLRDLFREKFRNISRIMDCVDCHRCRLWGKVQFMGIGTAMAILFGDAAEHLHDHLVEETPDGGIRLLDQRGKVMLDLRHNAVVALFNVFHRLAESVAFAQQHRTLAVQGTGKRNTPTEEKTSSSTPTKQDTASAPNHTPPPTSSSPVIETARVPGEFGGDVVFWGVLALVLVGGSACFVVLWCALPIPGLATPQSSPKTTSTFTSGGEATQGNEGGVGGGSVGCGPVSLAEKTPIAEVQDPFQDTKAHVRKRVKRGKRE